MCLLCEELWMPFEPPPQPKAPTFVADAPEPDGGAKETDPVVPPVPDESSDIEKR
jgi:hypothetical protein